MTPDGETGNRYYFVICQRFIYEIAGGGHELVVPRDPTSFPSPVSEADVQNTMASFPQFEIGCDVAALQSCKEFCELRQDNITPEGVRFPACLPTLASFIGINIQPVYQAAVGSYHKAAQI